MGPVGLVFVLLLSAVAGFLFLRFAAPPVCGRPPVPTPPLPPAPMPAPPPAVPAGFRASLVGARSIIKGDGSEVAQFDLTLLGRPPGETAILTIVGLPDDQYDLILRGRGGTMVSLLTAPIGYGLSLSVQPKTPIDTAGQPAKIVSFALRAQSGPVETTVSNNLTILKP